MGECVFYVALELVFCRVQGQPILFQPNDRNKSHKYNMYGDGGKCGAALMFLIYHAKNREEEVADPCMDGPSNKKTKGRSRN